MATAVFTGAEAQPAVQADAFNINTDFSNENERSDSKCPFTPLRSHKSVDSYSTMASSKMSRTMSQMSGKSNKSEMHHEVDYHFTNAAGQDDTFRICEHWEDLLKQALVIVEEDPTAKVDWISNYNVLHYAVTKHNHKMVQYLLEAPECKAFADYVHEMDDFYKKPVDHLRNAKHKIPVKQQPLADYLQYFMDQIPVDKTSEKEILYEDIKLNGPIEFRKKKEKVMDYDGDDIKDAQGKSIQIYMGETGPDMTNIMTAYEVEQAIPSDMRKNFKICAKGGFDNFAGNWGPKGESPLHWAAARGRTDICRALVLCWNADPEEGDQKGRTAIQIAKRKKHAQLARELYSKNFTYEKKEKTVDPQLAANIAKKKAARAAKQDSQ